MFEEHIGVVRLFAGSYAPLGWAFCNGQALQVAQYPQLFALIGYTYGGSGGSFNVPDLTNLIPVGTGTSASGKNYALGQQGGSASVTLTDANLPPHTHTLTGALEMPKNSDGVNTKNPEYAFPAAMPGFAYATSADAFMGPAQVDLTLQPYPSQQNTAINTAMPTFAINYIIAVSGIPDQEAE